MVSPHARRYGEGVTSNAPGSQRYQLSPCPESAYIGSAALHEQLMHSDLIPTTRINADVSTPASATWSNTDKCAVVHVFPSSVSEFKCSHPLQASTFTPSASSFSSVITMIVKVSTRWRNATRRHGRRQNFISSGPWVACSSRHG